VHRAAPGDCAAALPSGTEGFVSHHVAETKYAPSIEFVCAGMGLTVITTKENGSTSQYDYLAQKEAWRALNAFLNGKEWTRASS
jgi:hypothetical protein